MNRAQKAAWFIVVNFTSVMLLTVLTFFVILPKVGFDKALASLGLMGFCGISGFVPIIFKKDSGKVQSDERDKMINRRAALTGFASAYLFVGLACMLPSTIMGPNANIEAKWLPLIFMGAGLSHFYVGSIAILIMYGRNRGPQ